MKLSDAEISSLLFDEQASDPATPASGFWRAFFKAGGLYVIDDAGVVTGPFGSADTAAGTSFDDTGLDEVLGADVQAALEATDAAITARAKIVNTDGDPGVTIYVGSIDPDVSYTPAVGDVWIEVP